jgi:hypothetical protein
VEANGDRGMAIATVNMKMIGITGDKKVDTDVICCRVIHALEI